MGESSVVEVDMVLKTFFWGKVQEKKKKPKERASK